MSFRLRRANKFDLFLTYNWANDKLVIKNSLKRKKKLKFRIIRFGLKNIKTRSLILYIYFQKIKIILV